MNTKKIKLFILGGEEHTSSASACSVHAIHTSSGRPSGQNRCTPEHLLVHSAAHRGSLNRIAD